jgi:hypothetical protein
MDQLNVFKIEAVATSQAMVLEASQKTTLLSHLIPG